MKVLKTAVAGLGRIGWTYHIPRIMEHEGFELVSIVDPMPERLAEGEENFKIKGYSQYSDLLENEELDLVVVASPTLFHAEHCISAMEKGIDVFVEKPIASTLEEADKIIEVMHKKNRKLMVYQPQRVTAITRAVKKIIDDNIIGSIYMIKYARSSYIRRNDWQTQKKYGGGMLNNYGAHAIDQLLYITGSKAAGISCRLRRIATLGDADDVVKAVIETDNGIILDIDINMAAALPLTEWILLGERGTAVYKQDETGRGIFQIKYYNKNDIGQLDLNIQLAASGRSYGNGETIPWHEQIIDISTFEKINFYDKCYEYFALNKPPFVPIQETREVMRIIDQCHGIGE